MNTEMDTGPMGFRQDPLTVNDSLLDRLYAEFKKVHGESQDLKQFLAFATDYLNRNRPVQTFYAEDNLGIVLSNHTRCLLGPPVVASQGGMLQTPLSAEQRAGLPGYLQSLADQGAMPVMGSDVNPTRLRR